MNHGKIGRRASRRRIKKWDCGPEEVYEMWLIWKTVCFEDILVEAGFAPGRDGKFNLPAGHDKIEATADQIRGAVYRLFGGWAVGGERTHLTITGAAPVWAYLVVAHALHGRVAKLTYASPNATVVIWDHGT